MVNGYLLDTNVIAELARPAPDPSVVGRVGRASSDCAMASVSWHELRFGVDRLPAGRRRDGLSAFLIDVAGRFPVLPYDGAAAAWHATERVRLAGIGRVPPFADAQIAATAAAHDRTLVTRNVTDFSGYVDLRVENWFDGPGT